MDHPALVAYRQLVAKLDAFCQSLSERFPEQLACRACCDSCCRHLTLFPVEAAALQEALRLLPAEQFTELQQRARQCPDEGPCPLLQAGLCRLYAARPLICRSHGLPLLLREGDQTRIDHCPLNFTGCTSLPGSAVLDLEALNQPLVAINQLFLASPPPGWASGQERLSVAETILQLGGCDPI